MIRPLIVCFALASRAFAQAITYRIEPAKAALRADLTAEQIAILEKLNRADEEHLRRLERVVVPSTYDAGELEFSPLPREIATLAGYPKAILVDQPHQVIGAYEAGVLVRWGPVSSGRREHPTPSGLFHLNWRSPGRRSTEDPDWFLKWYYNFHNRRGLALHQFDLPGRPASHACVRLLERDARWFYEWGDGWTLDEKGYNVLEQGTPLWILGNYDFGKPAPWLDSSSPHPFLDIGPRIESSVQ